MADTGFNWDDTWTATQKGAADWTADALADAATETSDATSLDGKAACNVSITLTEDNTGAIDGQVTVHILKDVDGTNYEQADGTGSPQTVLITPVQNDTVYKVFSVNPANANSMKIAVENQGGQELAVTVKHIFATIPAAS
jgi:hypothetical protein